MSTTAEFSMVSSFGLFVICVFSIPHWSKWRAPLRRCLSHRDLPTSLNLFLSPSIREYTERSSQASRHPLRNGPKSSLPRDRPGLRLSDLERCRGSPFAVQTVSPTRLSPVFRFGHLE